MKFSAGLSLVLASIASSTAVNLNKRETPLDVKLEMVGNTEVKATVTNTGASPLKVFKTGTFLDSSPIEKVEIYSPGKSSPSSITILRPSPSLDE